MSPKRIQRRRTAGWRMPEGAVYVGRPTRWGNLFGVGEPSPWGDHAPLDRAGAVDAYRFACSSAETIFGETADWSPNPAFAAAVRAELAGRDLACWCPLDAPCHADVLLEIANSDSGGTQ